MQHVLKGSGTKALHEVTEKLPEIGNGDGRIGKRKLARDTYQSPQVNRRVQALGQQRRSAERGSRRLRFGVYDVYRKRWIDWT